MWHRSFHACQRQRFEYALELEIRLLIRFSARILVYRVTAHGWPALISHRESFKDISFAVRPSRSTIHIVVGDLRSRLVIGKSTLHARSTQRP